MSRADITTAEMAPLYDAAACERHWRELLALFDAALTPS